MTRTESAEIKWHAIGEACKMYAFAYGAGFLVLAILDRSPEFRHLAQTLPWIPRYVGDLLAFAVTMVMVWRASQGSLGNYGFTLAGRNLKFKLSIALGTVFALAWALLDYSLQAVAGNIGSQAAYPITATNVVGMLSFQWISVGMLEEPLARGLVQTHLMNQLRGVVRVARWRFHVGTIVAGVLFGLGHIVPHIFFGQPSLFVVPQLALATSFGLLAGYIYQETRSLAGPIVMHNIVDGVLYTAGLF